MSSQTASYILCAVRSKPGGEDTVNRAIDLALETGARLTFVQIIDTAFIERLSPRGSSRKAAIRELHDMAEFTLSIVCDQARQRGVEDVDYLVRRGTVREELLALAAETTADVLILGRPKSGPGRSTFTNTNERESFVEQLERAGNLRVL